MFVRSFCVQVVVFAVVYKYKRVYTHTYFKTRCAVVKERYSTRAGEKKLKRLRCTQPKAKGRF